MWYEKCHIIIYNYLTFCTFSFEIKESSLSDTKCLIQYTVAPHCGDKRMAATLHEILSAELLCHDVISLKCGGKRQCKQRLFNVYSFILCIANSRSYCHSNYIVSILPASVRYTFLKKKKEETLSYDCTVTLKIIEQWREFGKWTAKSNVTSWTKCSLPQNMVHIC